MTTDQAERNIKFYYWFQIFREPLFWGPILITFIQRVSGMSLGQIYFMEGFCIFGIMVLEIPSGALADLMGRRLTIFLGVCLALLEYIFFASAVNPVMIWTGNLLWVVSCSLISGADSSFIFDTLKFLGQETQFKKVEGRSISYRLALTAICSIFVGYLAEVNIRLPVYLGILPIAVCCLIVYGFVEPPFAGQKIYYWREHLKIMKISVLFVANHKKLKWIIAFMVLVGTTTHLWFFSYNPYFELVELPLAYFGWIFFLLNLVAAASSFSANWLSRKIGDLGGIIMMILSISLPIMAMGLWVSKVSVFLILMQNITRGYIGPFMGNFLHNYLDSENRATVVSIKSAAVSLAEFVSFPVFGWLTGIISLPVCLMILGSSSLMVGSALVVSYFKIFQSMEN